MNIFGDISEISKDSVVVGLKNSSETAVYMKASLILMMFYHFLFPSKIIVLLKFRSLGK